METENRQKTDGSGQVWPPPPNVPPPSLPPPEPGGREAAFALGLSVFSVAICFFFGMNAAGLGLPISFFSGLTSFFVGVRYRRFWIGTAAASLQAAWFVFVVVFYFIFAN